MGFGILCKQTIPEGHCDSGYQLVNYQYYDHNGRFGMLNRIELVVHEGSVQLEIGGYAWPHLVPGVGDPGS